MFSAGVPVIDSSGKIVDMLESPDPFTQSLLHYFTMEKHFSRNNDIYKEYLEERYNQTTKILDDALMSWVCEKSKEYDCWRVLCWGPDLWYGELLCQSDIDVLGVHRIDDLRSASTDRDAVEVFSLNQQKRLMIESQILLHFKKARGRLISCEGSNSILGEGDRPTTLMHEVILLPGIFFVEQQKDINFGGMPTIELTLYPLSL